MPDDVKRTMQQSAKAFQEIVWPVVKPAFGNGELIAVEAVTDSPMAKRLDRLGGIDAWHVLDGYGMRGVASRVQVGEHAINRKGKPYNSFTVRLAIPSGCETEYAKRKRALDDKHGRWLFPYLTCQAFLIDWGGPLLSAAVAQTADIIECINAGICERHSVWNADFAAVFWADMQAQGYHVKIFEGERPSM